VADVFDHVTIRVSDVDASLRFYQFAFAQLGYAESYRGDGFHEWNDFSIWAAEETGKPVTRGLHLALVADSRQAVDDWWRAMTGAGHEDDGAPAAAVLVGLVAVGVADEAMPIGHAAPPTNSAELLRKVQQENDRSRQLPGRVEARDSVTGRHIYALARQFDGGAPAYRVTIRDELENEYSVVRSARPSRRRDLSTDWAR
jgi:catechol 2,3-dioxygenase-like lactoylglutathione lyase family enzyme